MGFDGLKRHQSSTKHIRKEFICRCQASPVKAQKNGGARRRRAFSSLKHLQGSSIVVKEAAQSISFFTNLTIAYINDIKIIPVQSMGESSVFISGSLSTT